MAQEEQTPLLNGLIQISLETVRANTTPEEIERGENIFNSLKKSPEEKIKEKNSNLSFF